MDVLTCQLTPRQTGKLSPWRTAEQSVGGERPVARDRGRHRRPLSACHFEWASKSCCQWWCIEISPWQKLDAPNWTWLMPWPGRACPRLPCPSPHWRPGNADIVQAIEEEEMQCCFFFFSFTGRLTLLYYRFIKAFAASISLEIYKSFTCLFIFICVRLVPATFKQRRSRRFYWRRQDHIMARRQMHSLNIQKMAQRTEMTNNCFSLQPLCVQGHGILEPWVLAAPWNLLLSFLSLCSSSIFPLWSNDFLGNLTKQLFFIVYINVCF